MTSGDFELKLIAVMIASLRLAPMFMFAPPFNLLGIPAPARLFIVLALSALHPATFDPSTLAARPDSIIPLVFGELVIGLVLALTLQIAFAALQFSGRAMDLQAGFGFAGIADPVNGAQAPLIGTLMVYAGAAVFFAINGPLEMLIVWSQSFELLPIGGAWPSPDPAALMSYLSSAFAIALGLAGLVLAVLFLIDLGIAYMSRTLPQMNVLVLGFQVKTIAVLLTLPIAIAAGASAYFRILRLAFDSALHIL